MPPQGYPPAAPKNKPKWPWIAGGIVALLVIAGLAGGGNDNDDNKSAATATTTTAVAALAPKVTTTTAAPTTVPAQVTLPDVAGRNGEIVRQELVQARPDQRLPRLRRPV
jgi:hypothetical protein